MSKERLEEIKEQVEISNTHDDNPNGYWYNAINWLIEQAELVEELEKIIDKFDGHSVRNGKEIMRLTDENADLKVKNKWLKYEMEREKHVGDKLEQQNKRYREAMEEIKRKIKNNDNRIERLSSERQFYDQSKKIERLNGEALGLEIALKIIDEALEESK